MTEMIPEPAVEPVETTAEAAATHTFNLPAGATVDDLRKALRRMNAGDRLVNVKLTNAFGSVWITGLESFEITAEVSA
ncbi:hypothetical protein [Pseudofrankia asymbiotica]|uniref:Uncharacterized protein n=1 Tax=Pseudofrankia asymbiotica TaxID=1834516 RepID=A0A1V2IKB8_9ACTN|nr:hypothetical protein [Pseudofrankia asymbiotica]ONH33652.1 hypothetical protein BL253_01140 [Pseudofrankia asymbiotica]